MQMDGDVIVLIGSIRNKGSVAISTSQKGKLTIQQTVNSCAGIPSPQYFFIAQCASGPIMMPKLVMFEDNSGLAAHPSISWTAYDQDKLFS